MRSHARTQAEMALASPSELYIGPLNINLVKQSRWLDNNNNKVQLVYMHEQIRRGKSSLPNHILLYSDVHAICLSATRVSGTLLYTIYDPYPYCDPPLTAFAVRNFPVGAERALLSPSQKDDYSCVHYALSFIGLQSEGGRVQPHVAAQQLRKWELAKVKRYAIAMLMRRS